MLIPVECPFHHMGVDVIQFVKFHSGNQYAMCSLIILLIGQRFWPPRIRLHLFLLSYVFVEEIVCRHGVLSQLLSNHGAAFLSYLLTEICKLLGTNKLNTTAYHP